LNTNQHTAGAENTSLRWVTVPAGLYLIVHLLSGVIPARLWGTDALAYLPISFVLPMLLASFAIFLPSARDPVVSFLQRAWESVCAANKPVQLALTCAVFVVLATVLSSAVALLGDGQLHIRRLTEGRFDANPKTDRAPLTFWILLTVYDWVKSFASPTDVYVWVSQAAGLGYLLASFVASRVFTDAKFQQYVVFLLLTTQGYVMLFFGYVENYAVLFPMTLLFLLLTKTCLHGRIAVWVPGVVLGLTVPMHLISVAMSPALAWVAVRRPNQSRKGLVLSIVSLAVVPATTSVVLVMLGLPFDTFLHSEPGSHTLPVFGPVDLYRPYALISLDHALALWNQYALVAPAFVICLGLARRTVVRNQTDVMLLLAALPLVCFTVVFNPEIGAFRDWDAFALPALPLTVLAARRLMQMYRDPSVLVKATGVVAVVSLVHTGLWIGLNASADASEARFAENVRNGGNSAHARSHGAVSMAGYYREAGRLREALEAFEEASAHDPRNGRFHVGRAFVLRSLGETTAAEEALKIAMALTPDRLEAAINLGKLYLETGRFAEAKSVLRQTVNRNEASSPALHALGQAHHRLGEYELAESVYLRALVSAPLRGNIHIDLAATRLAQNDLVGARESSQTAMDLDPASVRARMILGATHYQEGAFSAASGYFRDVVQIDSNRVDGHLNLGLSLLAEGDSLGARDHLSRALALDADDAEAESIRNLLKTLGQ
jgi:tetratricopeptide (TPR) repeat protein